MAAPFQRGVTATGPTSAAISCTARSRASAIRLVQLGTERADRASEAGQCVAGLDRCLDEGSIRCLGSSSRSPRSRSPACRPAIRSIRASPMASRVEGSRGCPSARPTRVRCRPVTCGRIPVRGRALPRCPRFASVCRKGGHRSVASGPVRLRRAVRIGWLTDCLPPMLGRLGHRGKRRASSIRVRSSRRARRARTHAWTECPFDVIC